METYSREEETAELEQVFVRIVGFAEYLPMDALKKKILAVLRVLVCSFVGLLLLRPKNNDHSDLGLKSGGAHLL